MRLAIATALIFGLSGCKTRNHKMAPPPPGAESGRRARTLSRSEGLLEALARQELARHRAHLGHLARFG